MDHNFLLDLGFTANQAKVYMVLLENGQLSAGKVAELSKLHRPSTYDILERLCEKGLAAKVKEENTYLFSATRPENLLRLPREQEKIVRDNLEALNSLYTEKKQETDAYTSQGIASFMNSLHNLLQFNEEIVVYGIPRIAPEMIKRRIPHFHAERVEKKIMMKHIYNFKAQERIMFLNEMPYTEAKYLPEQYDSDVSTVVCGDTTLLTHWADDLKTIHIQDKKMAEAYKKYFYLLYENTM